METIGNRPKPSETFGNHRKPLETFENLRKLLETIGNLRKPWETVGNLWKPSETVGNRRRPVRKLWISSPSARLGQKPDSGIKIQPYYRISPAGLPRLPPTTQFLAARAGLSSQKPHLFYCHASFVFSDFFILFCLFAFADKREV